MALSDATHATAPGPPQVLVVGAGLAGLACAVTLHDAGTRVTLLEADDRPGGRVKTDVVEGFRIDRGFQTLLDAYPEAQRMLDLPALSCRAFEPGALVRRRGRFARLSDPRRRPGMLWSTLTAPVGGLADRLRMARFADWLDRRVAAGAGHLPASAALSDAGFSSDMIEGFLRPFLRGVFLDPGLGVSMVHLAFVWRMFSTGRAVLPAHGMEQIPRQLVRRLPPESVRCGTAVSSVETGLVTLGSGERLRADAVMIATDATTAARLLGGRPDEVAWHGVTTVSYDAPESPVQGPWLVLAGDGDGPVNNVCAPSEVAPDYAPAGRHLVTASVLGVDSRDDELLDVAIRQQLGGWWGEQVSRWRLLHVGRIARALPVMAAPASAGAASVDASPLPPTPPGVQLCGDHLESPSINGALRSGRRAAKVLLERLSAPA